MPNLPIDQLRAHPNNSNVMPRRLLTKLVCQIKRTGRYPAVIVRPTDGGYQILDGHHRVLALRELDAQEVSCEVWEVDDREALMLLATLNRLQGDDDPRKRGALIDELRADAGLPELAKLLPEDTARLKKLAELAQPPPVPAEATPLAQMPQAVHFFLLPAQARELASRLRAIGGTREEALMSLVAVDA